MIIVSQEKDEILNFNNIMNIQVTNCEEDGYLISAGFIVGRDDNYRDLGYYKTEERAKEVLQEITQKYSSYLKLEGGPAILQGQMDIQPNIFNIPKVYEMPEKINREVIPMMYEFEMIGDVVGKARPRMNTRTGRAYTPTNTKNYEYFLRQWFIREYPNFTTIESRVKVTIIAYFGIPKSTSKKKEAEMLANIISPTKKPDADNIVKIVLDAMNKFAFKDDTQVTKLEIEKKYSRTPRIYVKIEEY